MESAAFGKSEIEPVALPLPDDWRRRAVGRRRTRDGGDDGVLQCDIARRPAVNVQRGSDRSGGLSTDGKRGRDRRSEILAQPAGRAAGEATLVCDRETGETLDEKLRLTVGHRPHCRHPRNDRERALKLRVRREGAATAQRRQPLRLPRPI